MEPVPQARPLPAPRKGNRRAKLLEAAAACFQQQGYAATSMRDIAAASGMQAGSIYYYFPSKEDLFVAVYEAGVERIIAATRLAVAGEADPWRRLEAASVAHLTALLEGGAFSQVLMRWELAARSERVRRALVALRDGYERTFSGLVEALPLPASCDRHHLRLMLVGALNFTHTWYRPEGASPERLARDFVGFLRTPLEAPPAAQPPLP